MFLKPLWKAMIFNEILVSFVFKLKTPWIPGSSPRMTILSGCFCSSFPQVLSWNPVSLMTLSTLLRMNQIFTCRTYERFFSVNVK